MRLTNSAALFLCIAITCVRSQEDQPSGAKFTDQFRVVLEWNVLDYVWPSAEAHDEAISSGKYIPENVLISDIKPYGNRLYLTVPRIKTGVPATLVSIPSVTSGDTAPLLEVFPSWEMNERGNCSALQFVQGVAVDAKGVMWVVDAGRTETLSRTPNTNCPPKLVLLDLNKNGTILRTFIFPDSVTRRNISYLNKIVVDGPYAYITDNSGADPGIVVYNVEENKAWKIREPNSMRAAKNAVGLVVNGTALNYPIHIDGIALGIRDDGSRIVYYSPLSSYRLYGIPASALRNESLATASPRVVMSTVINLGNKTSQSDGMVMDNEGIMYYGLLSEHAIGQWDSKTPFSSHQKVVAKDPTYIQWTDGMGFDEDGYLYVVVNRLQNFIAGKLNKNEVNFRVLRARTGTRSYVYAGGEESAYTIENLEQNQGNSTDNGGNVGKYIGTGLIAAAVLVTML